MTANIRNLPNKRRLASMEGCKADLKEELQLIFHAFTKALSAYEKEIIQTPPQARARGFEASLLNSKMIQSIQEAFPLNWKFGRYKRFTLRIRGYIILFKKLNSHDRPMNIQTKAVDAISNQLSLSLFDDSSFVAEPILFFGYKKDKIEGITDPKLVYIDEDLVKWTISEKDVLQIPSLTLQSQKEDTEQAVPKLKPGTKKKAAN